MLSCFLSFLVSSFSHFCLCHTKWLKLLRLSTVLPPLWYKGLPPCRGLTPTLSGFTPSLVMKELPFNKQKEKLGEWLRVEIRYCWVERLNEQQRGLHTLCWSSPIPEISGQGQGRGSKNKSRCLYVISSYCCCICKLAKRAALASW